MADNRPYMPSAAGASGDHDTLTSYPEPHGSGAPQSSGGYEIGHSSGVPLDKEDVLRTLPPVTGPTGGPTRRSSRGGWTAEEVCTLAAVPSTSHPTLASIPLRFH
ncbi:unnamed protein product [Closterium sp. NIES-54]